MSHSPQTNQLIQKIQNSPYKLAFASIHPEYSLALEGLLSSYTILTTPAPWWKNQLKSSQVHTISSKARATTTVDLLLSQEVLGFLKNTPKLAVLVFKSSFQLEKMMKELHVKLLTPSSKLARRIENKLFLKQFLQNTDISLLPQEQTTCSKEGFCLGKKKFGLPFILQFAKGFSGNSTFLIRNQEDFRPFLQEKSNKSIKITPWKEQGIPLTLNGCVLKKGVALSKPFLQITGIPELTPKAFASCGSVWDLSEIPDKVIQEIQKLAKKTGEHLQKEGYSGFFGIDILWVKEEGIYLIEINPRFTGSLNLFTKLQIERKETPFILLHLAEFLGLKPDLPVEKSRNKQSPVSQLIFHSKRSFPYQMENSLQGGIYKSSDQTYLRKGHSYLEIEEEEFLYQPVSSGTYIHPGKEIARVIWKKSVWKNQNLSKNSLRIAQWIRKHIESDVFYQQNTAA